MSVRSSILAVLSLGAAYGSQVHGEVELRTGRAGCINIGQVYSTLDRLVKQGCVEPAGLTADGLPQYRLTASGQREVETWIHTTAHEPTWSELVSHVLMVASLPLNSVQPLVEEYRRLFREPVPQPDQDALSSLGGLASQIFAEAALTWLDGVATASSTGSSLARPLGRHRPKRGRRPHRPRP